ncbi:homoserine dehydrogenase [Flavobacteriales bacterium]|nr:homoserine dehydrogenase [Flavobacteriales bacterium]
MKKLTIGLFGFGVVGEGIYKVLSNKTLNVEVKKIVIKDASKVRNAPHELFSVDKNDILNDETIDLVVELIDDAEAALEIAYKSFEKGKSVISANKKMIAENHEYLIQKSKDNNVSFLYEAAVCGSIPVLRNLEEYFDNDLLKSVVGIVNGSTNFIVSKMMMDNEDYHNVLKIAQEKGFAESDPTLDVEGIDAAHKLSIIALHAFGKNISLDNIIYKGITALNPFDFQYAKEKNKVIKLIAKCNMSENGELLALTVFPSFLNKNNPLALTHNEYNGVIIESSLADSQFFYGKGAGRYPTSSAVLSDISANLYGYRYSYKKGVSAYIPSNNCVGKFYVSCDNKLEELDSLFDKIEEKFDSKNRTYIVGYIDYNKLKEHSILKDNNYSIIQID